jgi:DNA polymerase III delta prime subunit
MKKLLVILFCGSAMGVHTYMLQTNNRGGQKLEQHIQSDGKLHDEFVDLMKRCAKSDLSDEGVSAHCNLFLNKSLPNKLIQRDTTFDCSTEAGALSYTKYLKIAGCVLSGASVLSNIWDVSRNRMSVTDAAIRSSVALGLPYTCHQVLYRLFPELMCHYAKFLPASFASAGLGGALLEAAEKMPGYEHVSKFLHMMSLPLRSVRRNDALGVLGSWLYAEAHGVGKSAQYNQIIGGATGCLLRGYRDITIGSIEIGVSDKAATANNYFDAFVPESLKPCDIELADPKDRSFFNLLLEKSNEYGINVMSSDSVGALVKKLGIRIRNEKQGIHYEKRPNLPPNDNAFINRSLTLTLPSGPRKLWSNGPEALQNIPQRVVQIQDQKELKQHEAQVASPKPWFGSIPAELSEIVQFVRSPKKRELYRRLNKKVATGILLYGPAGTGKTMTVHRLAQELGDDVPCFMQKGTELLSSFVHGPEINIKTFFEKVRNAARNHKLKIAIVCCDEFDMLCPKITEARSSMDKADNRMVTALKDEIGADSDVNIIFVGCTNHPENMDPAILRDGRLGKQIKIGYLSEDERVGMLSSYLVHHNIISDQECKTFYNAIRSMDISLSKKHNGQVTAARVSAFVDELLNQELMKGSDDFDVIRQAIREKLSQRQNGVLRLQRPRSHSMDHLRSYQNLRAAEQPETSADSDFERKINDNNQQQQHDSSSSSFASISSSISSLSDASITSSSNSFTSSLTSPSSATSSSSSSSITSEQSSSSSVLFSLSSSTNSLSSAASSSSPSQQNELQIIITAPPDDTVSNVVEQAL